MRDDPDGLHRVELPIAAIDGRHGPWIAKTRADTERMGSDRAGIAQFTWRNGQ